MTARLGSAPGTHGRRVGIAAALAAGGAVSGLGAYAFQLVAARALGPSGLADIAMLWTVQYLVTGVVLFGLEAYAARSESRDSPPWARMRRASLCWMAATALLTICITFPLRHRLFPHEPMLFLSTGASALTYGVFTIARGRMAAQGRTARQVGATALEGIGRVASGIVAGLGPSTVAAFGIAMPLAPLMAVGVLGSKREADRPGQPTDAAGTTAAMLPSVMLGNALGHSLVAGAPVLAMLTGAAAPEVATIFLATSLSRVPLVLAFNGLLPRLIPLAHRLADSDPTGASVRGLCRAIAGCAALASVPAGIAGWLGGPALIQAVFGQDYLRHPPLMAGAAVAAVLATAGFASGYILLARGLHRLQTWPWAAGLCAATVLLLVRWDGAPIRAAVALPVGAAIALAGLTLANHASRRTATAWASDAPAGHSATGDQRR